MVGIATDLLLLASFGFAFLKFLWYFFGVLTLFLIVIEVLS